MVSAGYHGETFEGPARLKMLKKADYLLSGEYLPGIFYPHSIVIIVRILQDSNKLFGACIGCGYFKGDVVELVEKFTESYMAIGLTIPIKVQNPCNILFKAWPSWWTGIWPYI